MSDSEQAFTEWSQKQIDTLWAERQRLEAENDSLRAQLAEVMAERDDLRRQLQEANIAEAELVMENDALTFSIHDHTARLAAADRELRRWRGCPSCKQDHDSSTDCPPHEARIKGRAWFHTQARDWEERAMKAEEQLAEMTTERDDLRRQLQETNIDELVDDEDVEDTIDVLGIQLETTRKQLAEMTVLHDKRIRELSQFRQELTLNAGMLARQCDLARDAEAGRDQLKVRVGGLEQALKVTTRELVDNWKIEKRQRDELRAERDAALARAEAAESAAGVMREALEVILIGTRKNRHNCSNCNSTFVEAEDALSHPEAQGERVKG